MFGRNIAPWSQASLTNLRINCRFDLTGAVHLRSTVRLLTGAAANPSFALKAGPSFRRIRFII
jgi:hypothetical protein